MIRRASEQDFTFAGSISGPATFNVQDLEKSLNAADQNKKDLRQLRASERVPLDDKKFKKVAFDLYQSRDTSQGNGIWKVQQDESGAKFLVRTQPEYFEEDSKATEAPESMKVGSWLASYDTEHEGVVLSYENQPLRGFLAEKYQFNRKTAQDFMKFLLRKACTTSDLIEELSPKMSVESIRSMMKTLDLTKANDRATFACLKAELTRKGANND
jgi:hypothetical protein